MYKTDARKLNVINELLKINSEAVLAKIEQLLKIDKASKREKGPVTIYDFMGFLSDKEAKDMKDAIATACETIDEDVWK